MRSQTDFDVDMHDKNSLKATVFRSETQRDDVLQEFVTQEQAKVLNV